MDYHEKFIKRDFFGKSQKGDGLNELEADYKGQTVAKKIAFDVKKPVTHKPPVEKPAGQGKPLGEDHEQQDSDLKVAEWVLSQDFDLFINRRKERLANFQGNILEIEETVYDIPRVSLEGEDIHILYDEIAPLELP